MSHLGACNQAVRARLEPITPNLVAYRGQARALYRLAAINYSWTSASTKHRTLADLVHLIEAAGTELSIHRLVATAFGS